LKEYFSSERHVVLIFCGGNISAEDLCRLTAP
jgi:hypothetical protein